MAARPLKMGNEKRKELEPVTLSSGQMLILFPCLFPI